MIKLIVHASPADGAINSKLRMRLLGRKRVPANSDRYTAFKRAVALQAAQARVRHGQFASGQLGVAIVAYWPTARGDVDAPIKAVLDGLQAGGLVDNDGRIVQVHARKAIDRCSPRVLVSIWCAET